MKLIMDVRAVLSARMLLYDLSYKLVILNSQLGILKQLLMLQSNLSPLIVVLENALFFILTG